MSKPVFSYKLTMNLKGDGFSLLHYRVFRDGKLTEINRSQRTTGKPKFRITSDMLAVGEHKHIFDILATKGQGMQEWLETFSEPDQGEEKPEPGATSEHGNTTGD
jgi:hypothetical protein